MILEVVLTLAGVGGTIITANHLPTEKLKAFITKRKQKAVAKKDELFPGVAKPTSILASLVASRILRAEWGACCMVGEVPHRERLDRKFSWSDEKVTITFESSSMVLHNESRFNKTTVSLNGAIFHLSTSERAKIGDSMRTAIGLAAERRRAAELAAEEQKALDAVEFLMGLEKPPEKSKVLGITASEDQCPLDELMQIGKDNLSCVTSHPAAEAVVSPTMKPAVKKKVT